MRFSKKFTILIVAILIMVIMQVYVNNIGQIEVGYHGYKIHIGVYTLCALVLTKWLIQISIKTACNIFVKVFFKNHEYKEKSSINNISQLIIASDSEFQDKFEKLQIIDKFKIIKTALMIKHNIKIPYIIAKTGVKEIDIHILQQDLFELIQNKNYSEAIKLVNTLIKDYASEIYIVQDEVLELSKYSKLNRLQFKFDPRKSKYNLSQDFVENYFITMDMIDFSLSEVPENKLKIIERIYKNFPNNKKVGMTLLEFIEEYKPKKYKVSKILDLIQFIFMVNPDRCLAYNFISIVLGSASEDTSEHSDFLKLSCKQQIHNTDEIFQYAQTMLREVSNSNIEKLWFFLIIATELKLYSKIKNLILSIIGLEGSKALYKFFIDNYNILSKDLEIIKLIGNN